MPEEVQKSFIVAAASNRHNPFPKPVQAAMETEAQSEASQHPNRLGKPCPQPPLEQDCVLLSYGGPEQTYALQHQCTMPSLMLPWTRLPSRVL